MTSSSLHRQLDTNHDGVVDEDEMRALDVNRDGVIDSSDLHVEKLERVELSPRDDAHALWRAASTAVLTSFGAAHDPRAAALAKVEQLVRGDLDSYELVGGSDGLARTDTEHLSKTHLRLAPVLRLVMVIYVGLSFFERPAWCYYALACDAPPSAAASSTQELPHDGSTTNQTIAADTAATYPSPSSASSWLSWGVSHSQGSHSHSAGHHATHMRSGEVSHASCIGRDDATTDVCTAAFEASSGWAQVDCLGAIDSPTNCIYVANNDITMPMSGLPMLSPLATGCIELICLIAFMLELLLMRTYRDSVAFWGNPWHVIRLVAVTTGLTDCAYDLMLILIFPVATASATVAGTATVSATGAVTITIPLMLQRVWRLAPIVRPIVCALNSRQLRKRILLTLQVMWDIKAILFLVSLGILWFGMVMFAFFRKFCQPPACDESSYYGTVPKALLSTFTILTTANFPDVYMSAYGYNRLFSLPFIAFAAFGIFFTLNLILATVYSSHKRRIATSFEQETAVPTPAQYIRHKLHQSATVLRSI